MTTQTLYPEVAASEPHLRPAEMPGAGQVASHAQGHWVLARLGKRVLRPGGIELTRQMLQTLAISSNDRVVEFAPGLGVTAAMVLAKRPSTYCGVEREPGAVKYLNRRFAGVGARVRESRAEESGLEDCCADVVYSEALLSMQNPRVKSQIIAEACRVLVPGGRYGIHELCLMPDDISDSIRREIEADMAKEIHVGVKPLCPHEWVQLLEQNGFRVTWKGTTPMHLLRVRRLLSDEGLKNTLRIAFRVLTQPELGSRVRAMRRIFEKYERHLGAVSFVCRRDFAKVDKPA